MTEPSCAEPLARRHRHAWLLATLTELIGDCAQAAGEVYRPVAEAPPTQTDVPVNLGLLVGLRRSAGTRVDAARAQDAARCATAEAEGVSARADGVPADVGTDFLTDLLDDPAQAVKRAQKLANTGQFTVDQILDEATDSAVLSGLLSLHEAQRQSDPSPAAAKCLAAAGHFALAVSVVLVHVPAATP
ncbi:hypothetical protein [Streptomyces sp. NBC_01483]|uniref:hypothetical protein n=1 Tax=Streptomyces sp. NBC_01483 TaxID=2903883 RepID=UPI002E3304AE|nr:hypothetical protein [Streptomyces sp. NBC_01483]